jgi:hypothetical protein
MSASDYRRIALIIARSDGDAMEGVATGYFLTANLVLTVRHVADDFGPDVQFKVRAEVNGPEKERWSSATRAWAGVGIDAMLLRTDESFENWREPNFRPNTTSGTWTSVGYPRVAAGTHDRKTLPLSGRYQISRGQGEPELSLTIDQVTQPGELEKWKGVSGSPIFLDDESGGLVGLITDVLRGMTNVLVALPVERLLNDIQFLAALQPTSFLGNLPSDPWCLVLTGEGTPESLVKKVAGAVKRCRASNPDFADPTPVELNVLDALASPANWAASVEALAKATFVVADVTSFQPGVMLLLGVRSVLRRGVTVSVTGASLSAHMSATPFNVQETKVLSSSHGEFLDQLSKVMSEGLVHLKVDANYLDLPAYLAVRAPRPENWAEEDVGRVLVLCPFARSYSTFYADTLKEIISAWSDKEPVRILDLRSPRLVGQSLYEQVRWSTHCLVDWTGWGPNVSFELGVRLACSDHQPLIIVQTPDSVSLESATPDSVSLELATPDSASPVVATPDSASLESATPDGVDVHKPLEQYKLLMRLFKPLEYELHHPYEALPDAIEQWARGESAESWKGDGSLPAGSTFTVAQSHFFWQQEPMLERPDQELQGAAERALGENPERSPERLVLFSANPQFDAVLTAAVREKWISAWLYLRHRVEAGKCPEDLWAAFQILSRHVESALTGSDDDRHIELRHEARRLAKAERAPKIADRGGEDD